jgi:hypothetical protein
VRLVNSSLEFSDREPVCIDESLANRDLASTG